jgi:integrase
MARPSRPWFRESKGTWYCTLDGKKVSLKVRGRENKKEAEEAWHRLFVNGTPDQTTEVLSEPPSVPMAEPKAGGVTVRDVVTAFLKDCEGRIGRKALHDYQVFLTTFAKTFGTSQVSALTTTQAETYARNKPTWSDSTQHDFLGTLSAAFKWAERTRLIDRTPLVGLRKPHKTSRGAKAVVTAETVEKVLTYADAHGDAEFAALVRFLWLTGCRPSEAANLTADVVKWDQRCAILDKHKTAHLGKVRVIYLSDEALAILRQQQAEHPQGYLFRRPSGGKWTTHSITGKFGRVSRKAGAKVRSYDFRHTFATDALSKGVPDAQVAELLGHTGTATLHKHYSHLTARSRVLREALERVR